MNVNLVLNPSLHMENKVFLAKIYRWNDLHSWFEVHKTFVPEKNIEYIFFIPFVFKYKYLILDIY